MKRVIREIITVIRIERWLIEESAATATPDSTAPTSPPVIEIVIEERRLDGSETRTREISRRILDVEQWEGKGD